MNTPGQNANAVAELVFGSLGQQEDFGFGGPGYVQIWNDFRIQTRAKDSYTVLQE